MAIGGWEVAGTAILKSGALIANQGPSLGLNYDPVGLDGGYTSRPNLVGKVHYPKTQKAWFDPTAFAAPLPAWAGNTNQGFGNAGKDSVLGPGRCLNFTTSLKRRWTVFQSGFTFSSAQSRLTPSTILNSMASATALMPTQRARSPATSARSPVPRIHGCWS